MEVSIHTPTKGVTCLPHLQRLCSTLFQSTHPRRVWPLMQKSMEHLIKFQSTHPRRVWQQLHKQLYQKGEVSIHTPTKGVTVATSQYSIMACFNPHTHEGCDSIVAWSLLVLMVFQSTHPRRVWRFYEQVQKRYQCFNPHTHEGCDQHTHQCKTWQRVSIHTPTKGVTGISWWV